MRFLFLVFLMIGTACAHSSLHEPPRVPASTEPQWSLGMETDDSYELRAKAILSSGNFASAVDSMPILEARFYELSFADGSTRSLYFAGRFVPFRAVTDFVEVEDHFRLSQNPIALTPWRPDEPSAPGIYNLYVQTKTGMQTVFEYGSEASRFLTPQDDPDQKLNELLMNMSRGWEEILSLQYLIRARS